MELNMQSLAQRKAARMNQVVQTPSPTPIQPIVEAVIETKESPVIAQPAATQKAPEQPKFDKITILRMAQEAGLQLAIPRKEYVKHSYSVTVATREKFKERCRILGKTMADGFEEAMEDFFRKTDKEFARRK